MTEQFRIKDRPQAAPRAPAGRTAVAAQPGNYLGPAPAESATARGLLQGLSALNPALAGMAEQMQREGLSEQMEQRQRAIAAGAAAGQTVEGPREVLTGAPIEPPTSVPPAFGAVFQAAMRDSLAQRVGVQNKAEAITEFTNLKDTEGFNPTQWLTERRQKALEGISDPATAATIGAHFTELEGMLRGEIERDRIQKREEAVNNTLVALAGDYFTANMRGEEMADAYQGFLQRARDNGKTGREASQYLLMQVQAMSTRLGGAPELFDVFDHRSQDGQLIGAHMRPQIEQARAQAKAGRDKELMQATERERAQGLIRYESDIDTAPEKVTMERILADMTKYGPVQSPEQAASLWNRAQDALRRRAATEQLQGQWGNLFRLEPGMQNKLLDSRLGPLMDNLLQAERAGDSASIAAIGAQIMAAHSEGRASVPWDQLKGYITTFTSNAPSEGGPSSGFQAGAALYRAMSKMPQYRDLYFDEKARKVFDAYIGAVDTGTDPRAAHVQAIQSVSPEAAAAAEAYAKTPEFAKLVEKDAKKYVQGSSWVPRLLGGNGRPENQGVVRAALASAIREHRARNPFATDAQMEEFAESWTARNFVLDTTTGAAVKVPPSVDSQAAQEALSSLSARVATELKLGDRNDSKWSVQYVPRGREGEYSIVAFNGSAMQPVANINLAEVIEKEAQRKVLTDDERRVIGAAKKALAEGRVEPLPLGLLAKAEALGAIKGRELEQYRERARAEMLNRINAVPKMSFGEPSFDSLAKISRGPGKVDHGLTARSALEFLGTPMVATHVAHAASLITAGEGVVLQAYDDPARGAGRNIGMGYNLKANAGRVEADLKQAGVPVEMIPKVVAGEAALTPEQAKRLTLVALPRYEKQARDVAEGTSKGLWDRMTPAQRAVMIDVAWQTGDPGQFRKAWAALASGDAAAFSENTRVYYTDRAGERKEDVRRNNLRASMLSGLAHWQAAMQKYGSIPSSKLQALALNNPTN